MTVTSGRRELLAALGGAAAAWPLAARAQQPAMPVVGFVDAGSAVASAQYAAAFRQGLNEAGYTDGRNVTVEDHWLEGALRSIPVGTTRIWTRCVWVIGHTGKLITALAHNSNFPIAAHIDDRSSLADRFWGSRHGAFYDFLIRHRSRRHGVLLSRRYRRTENDQTHECCSNVSHGSTSFFCKGILIRSPRRRARARSAACRGRAPWRS